MRGRRANHGRRGFTLLEILISLVAAMIVLAGVLVAAAANSKMFFLQSQIAELQLNARFALERIKADLVRTAFLGTGNSSADPKICPKPAAPLLGISIGTGGASTSELYLSGVNTNVVPDDLTLLGNFVNSDYFLTRLVSGTSVELQADNLPTASARYSAIFSPTAFLVLKTRDTGFMQIIGVSSAALGPPASVSLMMPAVKVASGQLCGLTGADAEGHSISVLNYLRYALHVDPLETGKIDLMREELERDGVTTSTTSISIAEYVVDFDVTFSSVDSSGGIGEPTIVAPAAGVADPATNPEVARSVVVSLTARTSREDPEFMHIPRGDPADPLRSYDVDATVAGAARVRTVRMEVELINLALAGR